MATRAKIEFTAEDKTRSAFRSVQSSLGNVSAGVRGLAGGLIGVAGVGGFGIAIKRSLEFADSIAKTADRIGIGVEALQEYRYAARRTGVDQSELDKSLEVFARRIGEADQGLMQAKRSFLDLGLSIYDTEGALRPVEELFLEVASAMQGVESSAERAAIANALFGRAGIKLNNLFREGPEGIRNYATEARDLGLVLGEDLARNAEVANDKLDDLKQVVAISFAREVTENAEAITTFADALIKLLGVSAEGITTFGNALGYLFARMAGYEDFVDRANRLGEEAVKKENAWRLIEEDILPGKVSEARAAGLDPDQAPEVVYWRGRVAALKEEEKALRDTIAVLDGSAFTPRKTTPPPPSDDPPTSGGGAGVDPNAAEKRAEEIRKRLQKIREEVEQFGLTAAEIGALELASLGASPEQIAAFEEWSRRLDSLETQAERRQALQDRYKAMQEEAGELTESLATPQEKLIEREERLELLLRQRLITDETYRRGLEEIREEYAELARGADLWGKMMEEAGLEAARGMQRALSDFLFDPFQAGLDGMLRSFVDTVRRMAAELASQAILRSLFGGFSGSDNPFLAALGAFVGGGGPPGRALGGPVAAGKMYTVGERGPELFLSRNGGQIVPNSALGGRTVVVNIDARGAGDPAAILALVPVIRDSIKREIADDRRRGV